MDTNNIPVVLTFTHSNPIGNCGIQADTETLASIGCHCAPVITAISDPGIVTAFNYHSIPADVVAKQARTVLNTLSVAAIKIGFIANLENLLVIEEILSHYPNIPVVLDPMLSTLPEKNKLIPEMISHLLPLTTLICLSSQEISELIKLSADSQNLDKYATQLALNGCRFAFITRNQTTPTIINSLYENGELVETFSWERLKNHYLGAGNILSTAIAGILAHGVEPLNAVYEAQEYTQETLKYSYNLGTHHHFPNRLFWARQAIKNHQPFN